MSPYRGPEPAPEAAEPLPVNFPRGPLPTSAAQWCHLVLTCAIVIVGPLAAFVAIGVYSLAAVWIGCFALPVIEELGLRSLRQAFFARRRARQIVKGVRALEEKVAAEERAASQGDHGDDLLAEDPCQRTDHGERRSRAAERWRLG
jgi:hypothetical protein